MLQSKLILPQPRQLFPSRLNKIIELDEGRKGNTPTIESMYSIFTYIWPKCFQDTEEASCSCRRGRGAGDAWHEVTLRHEVGKPHFETNKQTQMGIGVTQHDSIIDIKSTQISLKLNL